MRAHEFLLESDLDDFEIVEDDAVIRGDGNLANALETLRNQSHDTHDVPMIRVDSLINIVRNMPGTEMFNVENLMDAYKSNETIKNLISDIKDNKDGVKYAYLTTFADDPETEQGGIEKSGVAAGGAENTINSMAKRALSKRT